MQTAMLKKFHTFDGLQQNLAEVSDNDRWCALDVKPYRADYVIRAFRIVGQIVSPAL